MQRVDSPQCSYADARLIQFLQRLPSTTVSHSSDSFGGEGFCRQQDLAQLVTLPSDVDLVFALNLKRTALRTCTRINHSGASWVVGRFEIRQP
jgi:hypothetical protein